MRSRNMGLVTNDWDQKLFTDVINQVRGTVIFLKTSIGTDLFLQPLLDSEEYRFHAHMHMQSAIASGCYTKQSLHLNTHSLVSFLLTVVLCFTDNPV